MCFQDLGFIFSRVSFLLCLHDEKSSPLLLRVATPGVELLQKAEPAGLRGDVLASELLLQQVPAYAELLAGPPEAVDVPAQGRALLAGLVLVLLLHVIDMTIVPLPKGATCQAGARLRHLVARVARVGGGDGGLVDHSWRLAFPWQRAGWLVSRIAS